MPSFKDIEKPYVIKGEADIPEKYREEIENRLKEPDAPMVLEATKITSGVKGNILVDENEILEEFSDESLSYFGHGTLLDELRIESILEEGLRVINPENIRFYDNKLRGLSSTTEILGFGSNQLFDEKKELLNNWQHKNAKTIIIVSVPREYEISTEDFGGNGDRYKHFYTGSKKDGFYLRPEFIKGIYDANTHSYTENTNFYKNLDEETKKQLFTDIKESFIKTFGAEGKTNPEGQVKFPPLTEEEKEKLIIEWYKNQLRNYRIENKFNEQSLGTELQEIANGKANKEFQDGINGLTEIAEDKDIYEIDNEDDRGDDDDW